MNVLCSIHFNMFLLNVESYVCPIDVFSFHDCVDDVIEKKMNSKSKAITGKYSSLFHFKLFGKSWGNLHIQFLVITWMKGERKRDLVRRCKKIQVFCEASQFIKNCFHLRKKNVCWAYYYEIICPSRSLQQFIRTSSQDIFGQNRSSKFKINKW